MSSVDSNGMKAFLRKEQATIMVTDSGLGGISILAEIAAELARRGYFKKLHLVYVNAWPEQNRGYNRLKNGKERIAVFNSALKGMLRFQPDVILIACNTLSVLYPHTQFSRETDVPVVDIVEFGVDLLTDALRGSSSNRAVILGTVTTIESGVHRDRCREKGLRSHQLVSQACDQLATEIEKGPESPVVTSMIDTYMHQAAQKIPSGTDRLFAALCCTHFGFSEELIRDSLSRCTGQAVTTLNPNRRMAAFLLSRCREKRFSKTDMTVEVVSKIFWDAVKIEAISHRLQLISAETAKALETYTQMPDLFSLDVAQT